MYQTAQTRDLREHIEHQPIARSSVNVALPPWSKTILFRPRLTGLAKQFLRNNMGKLLPGNTFSPVDKAAVKNTSRSWRSFSGQTNQEMTRSILDRIPQGTKVQRKLGQKTFAIASTPSSAQARSLCSQVVEPGRVATGSATNRLGVREPLEDGHNDAVIAFEPNVNAADLVGDMRLMRYIMGSFPGQSAQLTPEQFQDVMQLVATWKGTG